MSYVLYTLAIVCMVFISMIYLQKPLKERGYEGFVSVLIRIVVGVVLGILIGFLMQM